MKSLLRKNIIIVATALLLMSSNAFASFQYEQILGFDSEKDLPILNERFRRLEDRVFQVKSSSSDTTPDYLDNSILNITVIGDVTDGTVAGWEINATSLKSGTAGTTVGLDSGGTNPSIYCGSATPASAPFRVTNAGAVTATSGEIGGWTLGASTLSSTNITIDSGNELIKSNDYTSGALGSGWQIDATQAEFQNIVARGKITTSAFETGTISTIGGNVLISHDTDVLNADMTALDASTLTIDGDVTFAVGDHLRIKDGTDDEWMTVSAAGSAPTYSVTRDQDSQYAANTNPIWTTGTAVVNYGQNLDGGIFITASETYAPYIDVYTIDATPWNAGITTRMRMGNLNGYLGYSTDLYGIAIGEATKYLKYDPTNGLRIAGDLTVLGGSITGSFIINSGGNIQSANYVADTSGVYIDHETIELNEGSIAGEGILETIMIYSMLFGGD